MTAVDVPARSAFSDAAEAISVAAALAALGQTRAALLIYRDLRSDYPDRRDVYDLAADLLRQDGRNDEASHLLREAAARFPNQSEFMIGEAKACRDRGQFDRADDLLRQAMTLFPNEAGPLFEYAWVAHIRHDWPEAAARWADVRARYSDAEVGYAKGREALLNAGLTDAAEALTKDAIRAFPSDPEHAAEYARLAWNRGDAAEAACRWEKLRDAFPDRPDGYLEVAVALRDQALWADAEALIAEALVRFPGSLAPARELAALALHRHDLPRARRLYALLTERFPTEHDDYSDGIEALRAIQRQADEPKPAVQAPAGNDQPVKELLTRFESLGGFGFGSEFGVFQRMYGADPLGLLGWADMPYDKLVETLRNRFDGVGAEALTELYVSFAAGDRGEYCTRDRRGMMAMRAFVYQDQAPVAKVRASAGSRLRFLARKLTEELAAGGKIFVFRMTDRNLTPAEIGDLHAAMRAYGDNTLLYVRYEDQAHPNGTVERVEPGLLIGYMDRFMTAGTDRLASGSWLAVCRKAYALWRAQPSSR